MGVKTKPDFSGYATKAGLKCSDGRVILPDAFKHQDGLTVPLVWQHNHSSPDNVLGHVILENRDDGVYAYGFFNDSEKAQHAKTLVQHDDINSLSIYANQLMEQARRVLHGVIREVSLVLAGANPGALIDNVTLAHADGSMDTLDDEAVIYTGEELEHAVAGSSQDNNSGTDTGADDGEDAPTVQEVYDTFTEEQKAVVHYMIGVALADAGDSMAQSADSADDDTGADDGTDDGTDDGADDGADDADDSDSDDASDISHDDLKEGQQMARNVFEERDKNAGGTDDKGPVLSHADVKGIVSQAMQTGSLKQAVAAYGLAHGIDNIEVLFPEARTITDTPDFDKRRTEWVKDVLDSTRKTPFSRIKSMFADITHEEARAKGYIKGSMKKEEWFGLSTRKTTPATIYKKQKLDRDDILDITDFDIVAWLWAEMRLMLEEELARAILIGDGRDVEDPDKIRDPAGTNEGAGIRSILHDDDLYAATIMVPDDADSLETVDALSGAMGFYKGSGGATFYTTLPTLTRLLLTRNATTGQRYWRTASDLAMEMGVAKIQTVEVMEDETDLLGIVVNLQDYALGTDRGGEIAKFDDFDIDYNQYKYLIETRLSGALTRIRSALVLMRAPSGATAVVPVEPAFTGTVVTVPTTAGVVYKNKDTNATLTTAAPVTLAEGASLTVEARPAAGKFFANNVQDEWTFTNRA
jgi:hypothetical protein